jgi:DNA adenine methylase
MIVDMQAQSIPAPQPLPPLKPALKWVGGKRWIVPHLQPLWAAHTHRRYLEPFCGGMALPLALQPRNAVLNDVNVHVVAFYRWLQHGLRIESPMLNEKDFYYDQRAEFNWLITTHQEHSQRAAELFYYLNRSGFNGLCRFNKRGEFNVPFGRYRTINYTTDFLHYRPALSGWHFSTHDFAALTIDPEDFIYSDPPYDVEFTQYSRFSFRWDDQVRLAEWLAKHPGPVVASNQATERIIRLYERLGFTLRFLQAPRMISCNGNRMPATEILATRNL